MHQISFGFFQRGITPEREITRTRKKRVSTIFPWGIHIWNFKTLACTVFDERRDGCTDGQPETNMLPQLLLLSVFIWWISMCSQHGIPNIKEKPKRRRQTDGWKDRGAEVLFCMTLLHEHAYYKYKKASVKALVQVYFPCIHYLSTSITPICSMASDFSFDLCGFIRNPRIFKKEEFKNFRASDSMMAPT